MSGDRFLATASAVVQLAHRYQARVIINDRADIARLAEADGVHVGQEDLAPAAVRALIGDTAIVGLSTHTTGQVDRAVREPVSYVAVGPIFGTATKATGYQHVGLEMVREAARRARSRAATRGHRRDYAGDRGLGAGRGCGIGGRDQRPARHRRPGSARARLCGTALAVRVLPRIIAVFSEQVGPEETDVIPFPPSSLLRCQQASPIETERVHSGWSIVSDQINRSPHGRRCGDR